MKLALYGATGHIGAQILNEALGRGHQVTAIVRDPARLSVSHPNLTVVTGDATDPNSVAAAITGHDAVIGSISGRRDQDTKTITDAAQTLFAETATTGVNRLLWVGGASSLEVAPGVRLFDTPEFPAAYKGEALAGIAVLDLFRTTDTTVNWTYLSPAAEIGPGERTGKFRLGGDQFMTDTNGNSRISIPDYAIALIDEVETSAHPRQRFTVAY